MLAFSMIWFGQVVSLLGTGMTQFAITIWAWKTTGSATSLAVVGAFAFGPTVLMSPIAGALVDRWNRKWVMILSDAAAALAGLCVLLLYLNGGLQIWHLCITGALAGMAQSFQLPAYMASVTMLIPKEHHTRANGMLGMIWSISDIGAPILGGAVIALLGIGGVMTIDLITFAIAMVILAFVHIPQPARSADGEAASGSLLKESVHGFRYIAERRSLLGLQLVFMVLNMLGAFYIGLISPMVLARTGQDVSLGTVLASSGIGAVAGGLLLSAWGGPKRRTDAVLIGMVCLSLGGLFLTGMGRALPIWVAGAFLWGFFIEVVNASNASIWQAKVAPDVQGRVFGARRLIAQILSPLAQLAVAPLADYVIEPAMRPGGALEPVLGGIFGTGPGAGMGLLLAMAGLLGAAVGVSGYLFPAVRRAEQLLPDFEAVEIGA